MSKNIVSFTLFVKRKDGAAIDEFGLGGIFYQLADDNEIFVADLDQVTPSLYKKSYQVHSSFMENNIKFINSVSSVCTDYLFQLNCVEETGNGSYAFYKINFSDGEFEKVYGTVTYSVPMAIKF